MPQILPTNYSLIQSDSLPEGLLDISAEALHTLIPEPTLFHLPGKRPETLFVSVLLHGNEPTGFLAVQKLLQKYRDQSMPRGLTLFFGNTQAARFNLRRLDGQPDFNRIWPGTALPPSPETVWAGQICQIMRQRGVFASIDVHNNTGLNPHYACINQLDKDFLHLGALFGRLLVYFTHPKGTQSSAFAEFCPAVTLECGRPGQPHGTEHAFEFLDSCLHLHEFPLQPVAKQDVDIYHTVAQVTVAEDASYSFSDDAVDLRLNPDLESLNFTEIPAGTVFGQTRSDRMPLIARDNDGNPVTEQFLAIENGQLRIARATMPSMLTLNERVIRQDCLCYLMERLAIDSPD
ncbi:M14 family metallopeptidase [Methylomonas montana]|uniref:M14 family metallopeptidase n=1 Tax=Methylomonas montana TaxID=3058963 RepID=UPI00265A99BC|nr:M14 family metallopeptidase [Methylomonas montana]WKJ89201.1 M14 family metallopeptidase [Methylomonas montana]